ncbi:MAG: helix-turn-helix transcriptional regulator [Rhodobacteraceae bacterium]|nr:helix-turn-helix transcriptional regulator [Paracoccaceae bacterium]
MTNDSITEPFLIKLKARIDNDPDITTSGLAIKAGLDNSAIRSMFKRGYKSLRITTARKICEALGTTYEEFMSEAQTTEEFEIVRLVSQLSETDRQLLLGFGQGLAAKQGQAQPKSGEDE